MTKITMHMTIEQASNWLGDMARLTAKGSHDWENFSALVKNVLDSLVTPQPALANRQTSSISQPHDRATTEDSSKPSTSEIRTALRDLEHHIANRGAISPSLDLLQTWHNLLSRFIDLPIMTWKEIRDARKAFNVPPSPPELKPDLSDDEIPF